MDYYDHYIDALRYYRIYNRKINNSEFVDYINIYSQEVKWIFCKALRITSVDQISYYKIVYLDNSNQYKNIERLFDNYPIVCDYLDLDNIGIYRLWYIKILRNIQSHIDGEILILRRLCGYY